MRARRGEPLQCCGISGIVSPGLLDVGETGSRRDDSLIVFRQLVPFFQIDHEVIGGAALPPTRIIIVGRNLMETELLIVIRTDPLGRIDGSFLKGRIDVTSCYLLRHYSELLQCLARPPTNAELQAL